MTKRELPNRGDLVDYGYAVAGHAGTLADEDGTLFIKPCTQTEIDFYEATRKFSDDFAEIMPLYMGTLSLASPTEASTGDEDLMVIKPLPAQDSKEKPSPLPANGEVDNVTWVPNKEKMIKTEHAVVLENCTSGYKCPNILDAKLGVRLWADDAPLQKRQRFDTISAETTHSGYGCRIAGMRVYKGSSDPAELDEAGYRIYDREYGRTTVTNENFVDAVRGFVFNEAAGVDKELGKAVCAAFAHDLARVEEVLASHETRMYSSSILFVFEGDGAALERAIKQNNELAEVEAEAEELELGVKIPSNTRIDSGIGMLDDEAGYDEGGDNEQRHFRPEDFEPSLDSGLGGHESDDEGVVVSSFPKVYSLKLIDFAHAKYVPGQGPDENTLVGVRSLRRIFEELAD